MTAKEKKYVFGPVPSRRLGLSLGVDIVPFKVCSLDCIYCQVGETTQRTIKRKEYVPVEAVLTELKEKLDEGLDADFITFSGSGEPTLHAKLGKIIEGVKKITDKRIAVLTNGTLFWDKSVRADCAKADVVLPSLDAGDEQTFRRINRPHSGISMKKLISGLKAFSSEFAGQIWLEVFFVEGLNTDDEQIEKIKNIIEQINPDKVQINTAVRPTAMPGLTRITPRFLKDIADKIGQKAEVVADFSYNVGGKHIENKAENVLLMLKRRPCSLNDISAGLGIGSAETLKFVDYFLGKALIESIEKDGITFFKTK